MRSLGRAARSWRASVPYWCIAEETIPIKNRCEQHGIRGMITGDIGHGADDYIAGFDIIPTDIVYTVPGSGTRATKEKQDALF